MVFKYRPPSPAELDRRANAQGGDFVGFIKDEYKVFTPAKGENWVRILPATWDDARHYGLEVFVHYGVGPDNAHVLCPDRMWSKPCPLCEDRIRRDRMGDAEMAKELKPGKRSLVWVINMKDPSKGPQVWAMPWTLDRDIVKISRDRRTNEYLLIDNPDNGYDIYFDREGDRIATKYTGLQLAQRPSSVDERNLDYIEEHPLPLVLLRRSYEEIANLYTGGAHHDPDPPPRRRDESKGSTEAERPSRTRGADDDDRPPQRRTNAPEKSDDDDDDDDRPIRRRRIPDEEEPPREPPRRERPVAQEADDEPPRRPSRDTADEDTSSGRDRAASLRDRFNARRAERR